MRQPGIADATAAAMFVVTIIVIGGLVAFTTLYSQGPPTTNRTSSTGGTGESGPISTFPAVWNDPCRLPVHGNATTANEISLDTNPDGGNFSLSQLTSIYAKIVNSTAFKSVSEGHGWVTTAWASYDLEGPGGSFVYLAGQFLLLSGNRPDESIQASYNVETGAVSVTTGLGTNCPAGQSLSSSGATLDKGSPGYYATGEPVRITFQVFDYNLTYMSVTSCLGKFTILRGFGTYGPEVYDSTKHPGCGGTPLSLTLEPGQSYNQTLSWNQTNDSGVQVPPGIYEVMGTNAADNLGYNSPIGVVYVGLPVSNVNSTILHQQFYFQANVGNEYATVGQPIKVVWVLQNSGQQVYDLETSGCSYSFKVYNLTGALIFNSDAGPCNPQLSDYPAPPSGGVSQVSYWNQTDESGGPVGAGYYHFLIGLHIWSGGREFNLTGNDDLAIETTNVSSSVALEVGYPSICTTNCVGPSPSVHTQLSFVGNPLLELKSLELYVNGTYAGTVSYNCGCYWLTYVVTFNMPLASTRVPVAQGAVYELVFVATFQNGNTSIGWAYSRAIGG
jgi:hypothetical protein